MANKGIQPTDELIEYVLAHSIPRTEVHRRLVEETERRLGDRARMQISVEQGPLLTFLVRLVGARRAVEIGTFTGLSALCIAEGLPPDGQLTCFDVSEEWTSIGVPYWEEAGVADRIERVIGPAAETLEAHPFDGPVDFAFIDADKAGYLTYVDLLLERMRPGGLIVADNALFGGAVLDPDAEGNPAEIRRFNDHMAADERVDAVLVNVGDGLMLLRVR
ncbi:MAG TPA: O-methyltransferase [Microthrixaceae bacterium]|nr:O-methyltransferase [Microthrixaceae bacterium]